MSTIVFGETINFPTVAAFSSGNAVQQSKFLYAALRAAQQAGEAEVASGAHHYTPTNANVTATSSQAVASNALRAGNVLITNTGAKTAWLSLGSAAQANKGIPLLAGASVQISAIEWKGYIAAICAATETTTLSILEGFSA